MLKNLSKKTKIILLVSHIVLLVLIIFISYRFISLGEEYRQDLTYSYTRSVGEITEHIEKINETFGKVKYTQTPTGQLAIASALREDASSAKIAVSFLPFSSENSEKVEKSLEQISDFALYIEKKTTSGDDLSQVDYINFETLQEHAKALLEEFLNIQSKISEGKVSVGETQEILQKAVSLPSVPSFDEDMSGFSDKIETLPEVDYDGLYSDHILRKDPIFLRGKNEVSSEQALDMVADLLQISKGHLKISHETQGVLASYQIEGDNCTVKVTKTGGQVAYFKKTLDISENKMSYEDALKQAKEYLSRAKFENIKETNYIMNDNVCTINFVAVQDDVLLYPDLLTVSVELSEGSIMEFTSTGYLMNHTQRDGLSPKISLEDAEKSISQNLTINSSNLAIIPSAGQNEILTYEFNCKDKSTNQEVVIFINANTGFEEQINLVHQQG